MPSLYTDPTPLDVSVWNEGCVHFCASIQVTSRLTTRSTSFRSVSQILNDVKRLPMSCELFEIIEREQKFAANVCCFGLFQL